MVRSTVDYVVHSSTAVLVQLYTYTYMHVYSVGCRILHVPVGTVKCNAYIEMNSEYYSVLAIIVRIVLLCYIRVCM